MQTLHDFNLHTIVRLPEGVFAPYTGIPTNILFFDTSNPTKEIWYYEIPSRDGGRYSKSRPMQFEEYEDCLAWWNHRNENEFAWKVSADEFIVNGYNLDKRNPNAIKDIEHLPPDVLTKSILEKETRIAELLKEINTILEQK